METVTISPKFQVVIPKGNRERLKLRPGQKVQAILYDDRIELVPVRPAKAMKGFLKGIDTKLSILMADSVILATAAKMTTADYGVKLKTKEVTEVPNGITFAGGVPVMRGAEFIGAVGTSGVQAIQDEQVSKAGASVIK